MKMLNLFLLTVFILSVSANCTSSQTAVSPPALILTPPDPIASTSLDALLTARAPARDMVALTEQLKGMQVPRVAQTTATPYEVGAIEKFWVKDLANNSNRALEATLIYRSDALNMWLEVGQHTPIKKVTEAAARIENEILPTNRAFFGTEWQPGVDGDNRVNILHVEKLGGVGAAYFWSGDEYVTAVNPYSNQRELLILGLDATPIGDDEYYANIAHEHQHLIHWHIDTNEMAWLNEGLAELAAHLNGATVARAKDYAAQPDIQLNQLRQEPDVINAHYAAAFLFSRYLLDRFGAEATQTLVQHPHNGLASLNTLLPQWQPDLTLEQLLADWLTTNYLTSRNQAYGIYQYSDHIDIPNIEATSWRRFPVNETAVVHQYGADFIHIRSDKPITVNFTGSRLVNGLPTPPHSGDYVWATIPADESDQHLTRSIDLSDVDTATLTFWTWYDIEAGWDYGYVGVSVDNGRSWQLLQTTTTTNDNPQGNSFGPGYTGVSGSETTATWVQETADLSPFVGQSILIRFQYITDGAIHNQGLLIDDVTIPEIPFTDDMESGDNGWQAAGFARIGQQLPQQFLVQSILLNNEDAFVEPLPLPETQQATWTLPLNENYNEAVLIIAGTTAATRQTAVYRYELTQP